MMLGMTLIAAGFLAVAGSDFVVPEGKEKTDRSIVLDALLEAAPERVFEMWIDAEASGEFFGSWARIEKRVGGKYEIYFLPPDHPEGDANSSKGARLLHLDPPNMLAFEWTAPPFAAQLNEIFPLPTWVEVRVESLPEVPGHSRLQLEHHGFRRGPGWDETYEFFVRAWSQILFRLDRHLASGR